MTQDRVMWLAGPLPPPLHGQAIYNVAFAAHLRRRGPVRVVATGDGLAGKVFGYGRFLVAASFRMRRGDVVYASMPGQSAAWLFAVVIAALRLRGIRHFVHHHSFRSIVRGPSPAMRAVVAFGGALQHHILLSPSMRDRFAALYLGAHGAVRAHALSNALLFCPAEKVAVPRPARPPTLGHLSVLTRDKGVDTLLRLFRGVATARPDCRLVVAGPVGDESLRDEITAAVRESGGRVEWRGPVADEAKRCFYEDVDVFVFPTRLVDEAEPLVMLEAYAAGVDVLATGRGCIPERLRAPDRILTGDEPDDVARIARVLAEGETLGWEVARAACRRAATDLRARAEEEARALFAVMFDRVDDPAERGSADVAGRRGVG